MDDPLLKEGDLIQEKQTQPTFTFFCLYTPDKVEFLNQLMKRFNNAENVLCRVFKWKSIGVFPPRKMISIEERQYVESRIIKMIQQPHGKDLEDSCTVSARKYLEDVETQNGKKKKEGKKW